MSFSDETIDPVGMMGVEIIQPQKGYRFSMDPFLLCGFSKFDNANVVYDLGCGNGVIPLIVACKSSAERIVGIERQPQMVNRAKRSVILNDMSDRITILEGDIRQINGLCSDTDADVVLINPPFRSSAKGRVSNNPERAAARHELAGGMIDFLKASDYLLSNGGKCFLIVIPERLAETMILMDALNLKPARIRTVHHTCNDCASLALVEGIKGGNCSMTIEGPLYLRSEDGREFSDEVLAMYRTKFCRMT
jgi:tRNA1Val (adenine37-N6)-methyltransferase